MDDTVSGSLEALNSLQLSSDLEGMDAVSKDILKNKELALLRSFPNVTVSHHMAFYTKNYVETVVKDSLMSCKCYMEGKENPWEIR